jgi:C-terminal processing protease CtpA/Prc
VAFLADARAVSYTEGILGIVEHYALGAIVGQPTAGANGTINPFTLPGGYEVTWTGMRVRKHDGSPHHRVGIRPTRPVERTREGVRAGRNEVLQRAAATLRPRRPH